MKVYVPITMNRTAIALTALALAIAGCGSSAPTPEDEIRETARAGAAHLASDHPERSCELVIDRDQCIGAMVLVKGMDVASLTGLPDDWEERLEDAKITVTGDTATITDFNGDGKPGKYVRKDGKWLADNR